MRTISKEELNLILKDHALWDASLGMEGTRADLRYVDLRGADLRWANLKFANLESSILTGADLKGASLVFAILKDADLRDADLRYANLTGAELRGTEINFPIVCPEKGSFIGFKKAGGYDFIVELEIPDDALRSSATTRKCRCSKAKVLSITKSDDPAFSVKSVCSNHDRDFIYTVGETVEVPYFDTNRWNECSTGIHFFLTRQEAVDYLA